RLLLVDVRHLLGDGIEVVVGVGFAADEQTPAVVLEVFAGVLVEGPVGGEGEVGGAGVPGGCHGVDPRTGRRAVPGMSGAGTILVADHRGKAPECLKDRCRISSTSSPACLAWARRVRSVSPSTCWPSSRTTSTA